MAVLTAIAGVMTLYANASEEGNEVNRYKTDFEYQHVGYQILSESERTVAVTQDYDIDYAFDSADESTFMPSFEYQPEIGENGFLMSLGLRGDVVIPQTVYDRNGTAYTVTALANGAINHESTAMLVLPQTITDLNGGIIDLPWLKSLYLPESLKQIEGIYYLKQLTHLHIPRGVEAISDYALSRCGLKDVYLPTSVKALGSDVLSGCGDLKTAMISAVETMGDGCFSGCSSLRWANLPETLKSMGSGCFNNCTGLERVSLPWSEINMDNCFNGCPSIKCIDVLAEEPYPFPANCFNDVDRTKCELLVPEGSVGKYMAADGWKDFCRINGIPTSGTGSVKSETVVAGGTEYDLHGREISEPARGQIYIQDGKKKVKLNSLNF